MYHAADGWKCFVQLQMGWCVRRGFQVAFNHVAFQVYNYHVFEAFHYLVIDPTGFDHHKAFFAIDGANVAPGENHQSMFYQVDVWL
jgi:hypothetical protein